MFATVALAFILVRIGAVAQKAALRATYFSIFLYLGAGIIGTFHHLYFTGSPLFITALGATFSALEIVPLTLRVRGVREPEAREVRPERTALALAALLLRRGRVLERRRRGRARLPHQPAHRPLLRAGLNTTPIHSHGALFGVYGFLAIALMLFSMRNIVRKDAWNDRLLKGAFWGLNGGLAGMIVFSLLPAGIYQFAIAIEKGLWFARSPEVTGSAFIHAATWARLVPDLVFLGGAGLCSCSWCAPSRGRRAPPRR